MNKYKIQITQRAYFDIVECVSFVNNVSAESGKALYDEIIDSIGSLKEFPNRYPEIENLKILGSKVRKMSIHNGKYLILYKVSDEQVTIYDIVDCRKGMMLVDEKESIISSGLSCIKNNKNIAQKELIKED